ncbi:hypothetical protein ABPG72_016433 [Tetrahymena utriculariae]
MIIQHVNLNVLVVHKYVIKITRNIIKMQEEKDKINTLQNVDIDLLPLMEQKLIKKIYQRLQHVQIMKMTLQLNIKVSCQNGVNSNKIQKNGIGKQILKNKKNCQDKNGKRYGSQLKKPKQNHGGGTCYSTVFSFILQILNHQQNENFIENTMIFFLSDGVANKPVQEIQQLLTKNKLIKEVQFIGFGNNDFNVLKQMVSDLQILNASFKKVLDSEQLSQQFQNLSLIIPS